MIVKVGDKIRILRTIKYEGRYVVGDIHVVTEVDNDFMWFNKDYTLGLLLTNLFEGYVEVVPSEQKEEKLRKGDKFDSGKPMIRFLTREFLEQTALAQTYGAKKYGPWNFQKGLETTALYDAALRHMMAWMHGENLDPESGLSHLGHASANLNMLIWMLAHKPEMDDRPKGKNE